MNRPYKEFKDKWLSKRIDYDKNYGYQCVDLIKQYLDECLGWWTVTALGNANQIPANLLKKWFWEINPTKSIIQWDIIVRTKWKYWHIAIVDRIIQDYVYVLEQNWSWKNSWSWEWENAIRIKEYHISRFQTVLRNEDIIRNYNKEMTYVKEKIEEREVLLRDTIDYKNSLKYPFI